MTFILQYEDGSRFTVGQEVKTGIKDDTGQPVHFEGAAYADSVNFSSSRRPYPYLVYCTSYPGMNPSEDAQ